MPMPKIVTRAEWQAKEPKEKEEIVVSPATYLVFTHTYTSACKDQEECTKAVQDMQRQHMEEGHPDILYNYLVTVDGIVYEGRGPTTVGVTYPEDDEKFSESNKKSIHVACIDDGVHDAPDAMVRAVVALTEGLKRDKYLKRHPNLLWYRPKDKRPLRREKQDTEIFEAEEFPEESPCFVKRLLCRFFGCFCEV